MFNRAAAGFLVAIARSITMTVPKVTTDCGTRVALVQVTDENGDVSCHSAFVELDVFENLSLTRDCSAVDKDIFIHAVSGDKEIASLHVKPLYSYNNMLHHHFCHFTGASVHCLRFISRDVVLGV